MTHYLQGEIFQAFVIISINMVYSLRKPKIQSQKISILQENNKIRILIREISDLWIMHMSSVPFGSVGGCQVLQEY